MSTRRPSTKGKRGELLWHAFVQAKWAVTEPVFATMRQVLANRRAGVAATDAELAAAAAIRETREREADARRQTALSSSGGGVYVVPVYGIITQRSGLFSDYSGGCSVEDLVVEVREAIAMPSVAAVVLDFDSPGGSVYGVPEAFDALKALRGSKPLVALCDPIAASAAYWLACACDSISCIPSGEAGSVGVYVAHNDFSGMNEQIGLDVSYVYAGKYKVEGNPDEPLSGDARAYLQQQVDATYQEFVSDVSEGRGVSPDVVIATFGEGRVLLADDALQADMIDKIETFDQLVQRLTAPASGRRNARTGLVRPRRGARADDIDDDMVQPDSATGLCPEGYELDADSGLCMLKESKMAKTRRSDHTDVGRGKDGQFSEQCECSPQCACMQGGSGMCDRSCQTCELSCPCVAGASAMASTTRSARGGRSAGVVPANVSDKLAPKDTPWSAPTLSDFTDKSWADLNDDEKRHIAGHFAWAKEMPQASYGDLKLPHHRPSDGAVVYKGVTSALGALNGARGSGVDIPEADKPKVESHLKAHEAAFDKQEAAATTTTAGRRQAAAGYQPEPYHPDEDETVLCPNCEKRNDTDARYCDQCGYKLIGATDVKTVTGADDDEDDAAATARLRDEMTVRAHAMTAQAAVSSVLQAENAKLPPANEPGA